MHLTHVLITRPLEASQQLSGWLDDQFDSLALYPIVMPFYTFSAHHPGVAMDTAWSAPPGRKLAVFTSPRAVRYGLLQIPLGRMTGLEFAAVGSATRTQLEAAGHEVHIQASAGFTSEDLLQEPALTADPGEAVIFCAPGGRVKLARGLETLGWRVFQAMVYERMPVEPASEQIDTLLAAAGILSTWTSVSALVLAEENLPARAWAKILDAPALVISARIQHHLQQRGASRVALADGPGNPALLESIKRLAGQPG